MGKSSVYNVEITNTAFADLEQAFEWLSQQSESAAERWRESLLTVIESLEQFPERFPIAPETEVVGGNVRQLLHGKRTGVYRILFEIEGTNV